MQCPLSEEDCDALREWAEELEEELGGSERAGLLRRAVAQGRQSRELQRQQSTPLKRFIFSSCTSPRSPVRGSPAFLPNHSERSSPQEPSVAPPSLSALGSHELSDSGESRASKKESAGAPGEGLPSILDFCVDPPVLHVQRDNMFETRLGNYLKRRSLLTPLLLCLSVVLCGTSLWEPLATDVPEDGGVDPHLTAGGRAVSMRITRPGLVTWLLKDLSMVPLVFCVMHYVNRDLFFRALHTFDAVMILGCFAMSVLAHFYNMFDYWAVEGYYDTAWLVFDIVDTVVVVFPEAILISTMDSWRVLAWVRGERLCFVKILVSAMVTAFCLKRYLKAHLEAETDEWTQRPACLGFLCTTPKEIFMSAELTKVIFLVKLIAKYAMGRPFAFIRPIYSRHDAFKGRAIVNMLSQSGSMIKDQLATLTGSLSFGPKPSPSVTTTFGSILPGTVGNANDSEIGYPSQRSMETVESKKYETHGDDA